MIDRDHDLPLTRQAAVLNISRGSLYYKPRPVSAADLALMRRMDELHLEFPFAGARMLQGLVAAEGSKVGRRHVRTLMRLPHRASVMSSTRRTDTPARYISNQRLLHRALTPPVALDDRRLEGLRPKLWDLQAHLASLGL